MSGQSIQYRYSAAFKQKVSAEIESGHLTISQAQKVYDIRGSGTIHFWLKRYGKNHLLNKVVRIEMKDEKDKLKELAAKNRELESALAQTQLKLLYAESLLASVEAHYDIDVKKTFGSTASRAPLWPSTSDGSDIP